MQILETLGWEDYELLDSGDGYRLERFGEYTLAKPDPQAIWKKNLSPRVWNAADAVFVKKDGQEKWVKNKEIPEKWVLRYKNLSFYAKLSPFKHTGVFPEQHIHWDYIQDSIKKSERSVNILNLFAYTGIASLAAAASGAKVTHVDASRPAIGWAKESQLVSHLEEKPIRWILDDALTFVQKEARRGNTYDGIIMDPPVYGHGPDGELWDFDKSFPELIKICSQVLSDQPLFMIVNAYAISSSALMLGNVLRDYLKKGRVEVGELVLNEKESSRPLSTGIFAKWSLK